MYWTTNICVIKNRDDFPVIAALDCMSFVLFFFVLFNKTSNPNDVNIYICDEIYENSVEMKVNLIKMVTTNTKISIETS